MTIKYTLAKLHYDTQWGLVTESGFLLEFNILFLNITNLSQLTYHISDVQDFSGHGLFVVGWSWSKP